MTDQPLAHITRTVSDQPLLVVDDLHTSFKTERGLVRAVDGSTAAGCCAVLRNIAQ